MRALALFGVLALCATPGCTLILFGDERAEEYARSLADGGGPAADAARGDTGSPDAEPGADADAGAEPDAGEIDTTGCALAVEPRQVVFGAVLPGQTRTLRLRLTSRGTGTCTARIAGFTPGNAAPFAHDGPGDRAVLPPMAALDVRLAFTPDTTGLFTTDLEIDTADPSLGRVSVAVSGSGHGGDLALLPAAIDFGQVVAGCANAHRRAVYVVNNSTTAARITGVSLAAGSSGAFELDEPGRMLIVPALDAVEVGVRFKPQQIGAFEGRLRVEMSGGLELYTELSGQGAATGANNLAIPPQPDRAADILFVVDDSPGMAAAQASLSAAIAAFIDRADASGADYRIAVVPNDPAAVAEGRASPTVIAPSSATRAADLARLVQLGEADRRHDQGLAAARVAVTSPRRILAAGFPRTGADLAVVLFSSGEDLSRSTRLADLGAMAFRPFGLPGTLRVITIGGGAAGCLANGVSAGPASRAVSAAVRTGGSSSSICAADLQDLLTVIAGEVVASPRSQLQLGTAPAPGATVEVRVDGRILPASDGGTVNWALDSVWPRVVFAAGRAPSWEASVTVSYDASCVATTCGNSGVESGEQCDDGPNGDGDACPSTCYRAVCGDGFVHTGVEQCDDGNTIALDGCNASCRVESCGNRITGHGFGETCDDGNVIAGDGCSDACRIEPLEADLAQEIGVARRFFASGGGRQLGNLRIADVTGDGAPELLAGEVGGPPMRANAGIVYGYATGPGTFQGVTRLPEGASFQVWGRASGDGLGGSLGGGIATGDVTGDGVPDLVVSAPKADGPGGRAGAGAIYVIEGGPALAGAGVIDLATATVAAVLFGPAPRGEALVLDAGDAGGDATADLLVGVPMASAGGKTESGAVYLVRGGAALRGAIDLASGLADPNVLAILEGAAAGDQLGRTGAVGNFGGSASGDVLVGTPRYATGLFTNAGAAWGVFGPVSGAHDLATSFDARWIGGTLRAQLGKVVAVGQIRGSGAADVVIGGNQLLNPRYEPPEAMRGGVDVFTGPIERGTYDYGAGATSDTRVYGSTAADLFGHALAVGDLNRDGFLDLVVMAPNGDGPDEMRGQAGEAVVITGAHTMPAVIDLELDRAPFRAFGPRGGSSTGIHPLNVAIGDLDGNGSADYCFGTSATTEGGRIDCVRNRW